MITTKENIIQYFQGGIKNKIIFAGIDFIGGKLIGDINITSPTGLKKYKASVEGGQFPGPKNYSKLTSKTLKELSESI